MLLEGDDRFDHYFDDPPLPDATIGAKAAAPGGAHATAAPSHPRPAAAVGRTTKPAPATPPDAQPPLTSEEIAELLELHISGLSDREAGVLRMRHGLVDGRKRTLGEIGTVYGVSSERIRQVEIKTLDKLRRM